MSSHDYIYNFLYGQETVLQHHKNRQCVLKLKTLCPDLKLLDTEDGDVRRFGAFLIDLGFVCLLLHTLCYPCLCTIMLKCSVNIISGMPKFRS